MQSNGHVILLSFFLGSSDPSRHHIVVCLARPRGRAFVVMFNRILFVGVCLAHHQVLWSVPVSTCCHGRPPDQSLVQVCRSSLASYDAS